MLYALVGVSILCILLLGYILFLRKQVARVNYILNKRLKNGTTQIVTVELLDSRLNELAVNINKCLKAEETLRLKVVHEENDFKQLIANISHDLRTPLTAIKGYLQLMEKEELSDKQSQRIAIMNKHVDELGYLINQFYEYAYLLDVQPEIEITTFSLSNMVTECLASIVPELESHDLQLTMEESNVWVEADQNMTVRIVQNLLRNCVTHAYRQVKVTISEGKQVKFHVMNQVRPDSDIDITRLFDRFYVADPARKTTGLGLSIVKLLAANMGCEISVSLQDGWIDFVCTFPAKEV